MEISRARADIALTRQPELSKRSKIVALLTAFGIRRQAKLDTADYKLFSADLEHLEMTDLEDALRVLSLKPRAEGQTAFPDLGTILEAVRGVSRARGDRRAIDDLNQMKSHKAAHPELYETPDEVKDMAARVAGKFGIKATQAKPFKEIDRSPELVLCPKCQFEQPVASNIRHWTAKELYEIAAVKEQSELIAERNRNMAPLPLGDVVDEVTA